MPKITAVCRPEDQFLSLRVQDVTSGIAVSVGNLKPGADTSVRGHAEVVQKIEFESMTTDEAKEWMTANGYMGTIKETKKKKKATTKKVKKSS